MHMAGQNKLNKVIYPPAKHIAPGTSQLSNPLSLGDSIESNWKAKRQQNFYKNLYKTNRMKTNRDKWNDLQKREIAIAMKGALG